jgi:glycosyltransferase involved in cell wall biosynthesis
MKISVVLPSYNHAHWLAECIESALNQSLKPHEIIVVDDGSKDNTREVVSRYPVKYIYQENAGISAARNKGLRQSTGDWIAFLDADDYWLPGKLELQVAAIHDEGLCYCATTKFYNDGRSKAGEFFDASSANSILRYRNFFNPSSVLVKRDVITQIGGFNEKMPAAEDWEAWLKLSRICKFVSVPERLVMIRLTGQGLSANPEIVLRSMDYIIAAGTADLPPVRRFIESRRMHSTRTTLAALKYRDKGDYSSTLRYALRAFACWPSPFYNRALKVLLLELQRRLSQLFLTSTGLI